jgi:hypothetical protein
MSRSGAGTALRLFPSGTNFCDRRRPFVRRYFLAAICTLKFILEQVMLRLLACAFCAPVATAMVWVGIVLYLNTALPEEQD